MITREQIEAARKDLGRRLADMRKSAELSQVELGRLVGYTRSAIANVETGRENTPRAFWAHCDQLFGANGTLLAAYDQVDRLVTAYRQQNAEERDVRRRQRVAAYLQQGTAQPDALAGPDTGRQHHKGPHPVAESNLDFDLVLQPASRTNDVTAGRQAIVLTVALVRPQPDFIPRTSAVDPCATTPNGRTLVSRDPAEDDDQMERRALFSALASLGVTASLPLSALEHVRDRLTRAAGIPAGIPDSLTDWQTVATQYAVKVPVTAPDDLLPDLLVDLADLSALVEAGHRDGQVLLGIAAQLTGYIAMCTSELGHAATTFRWWRTARHTADKSGQTDVRVGIRGQEGLDLIYLGHTPAPALRLADDAVRLSTRQAAVGTAKAHHLRAAALAASGDGPAARRALDDLSRCVDALPASVREDTSLAGYPVYGVDFLRARVHTALGDTAAARPAIDAAQQVLPERHIGSAKLQLTSAECLVLDGEVTEGIDQAVTVLTGPHATGNVKNHAVRVLDALPDPARQLPAARELAALTATA